MTMMDLLKDAEIDDLRKAWRADAGKNGGRDAFTRLAPQSIARLDPRPMAWIKPIGDYFYEPTRVAFPTSEPNRERCIIAIAAATDPSGPSLLPLHIFWGLMEGLKPVDIADTIALAGAYSGLNRYTDAMHTFGNVLGWIRAAIDSNFKQAAPTAPANAETSVLNTISIIKGTFRPPSQ